MDDRLPDPTAAVMAHGLLNSMAIIGGAARTLQDSWDALPAEHRDRLLSMIADQAEHVGGMLGDMARGLPIGALEELEALTRGEHTPFWEADTGV